MKLPQRYCIGEKQMWASILSSRVDYQGCFLWPFA
jgi:hypothetical protein